jgi:hypothetical protein
MGFLHTFLGICLFLWCSREQCECLLRVSMPTSWRTWWDRQFIRFQAQDWKMCSTFCSTQAKSCLSSHNIRKSGEFQWCWCSFFFPSQGLCCTLFQLFLFYVLVKLFKIVHLFLWYKQYKQHCFEYGFSDTFVAMLLSKTAETRTISRINLLSYFILLYTADTFKLK